MFNVLLESVLQLFDATEQPRGIGFKALYRK